MDRTELLVFPPKPFSSCMPAHHLSTLSSRSKTLAPHFYSELYCQNHPTLLLLLMIGSQYVPISITNFLVLQSPLPYHSSFLFTSLWPPPYPVLLRDALLPWLLLGLELPPPTYTWCLCILCGLLEALPDSSFPFYHYKKISSWSSAYNQSCILARLQATLVCKTFCDIFKYFHTTEFPFLNAYASNAHYTSRGPHVAPRYLWYALWHSSYEGENLLFLFFPALL